MFIFLQTILSYTSIFTDIQFYMSSQIYFHVGLERTGSTFLQRKIFPFFEGVHYINKSGFDNAPAIIKNSSSSRFLVSREFNRDFYDQIQKFRSEVEGEIYPIVFLRRHDSWLLSQYKRHIKNGSIRKIEEFFSCGEKPCFLNKDALNFEEKLLTLKDTFENPPLIIFYQDLVNEKEETIYRIASYVGAKVNLDSICTKPIHTSYSSHQLRVYHSFCNSFPFLRRKKGIRYVILYIAKVLPKSWYQHVNLYPEPYLLEIKETYTKDWEACLEFARQHPRG